MPYVITRACINDTSCVAVCPVNCIHPTPDEPDYKTAEMLYIDPQACIECGACMDACPVSAIYPDYELPESLTQYETMNADYYEQPENADYEQKANAPEQRVWDGAEGQQLRVAIVGSGPSACYAAQEILDTRGLDARVDMFERLPTPFGLVRYGVAPDHQDTKVATDGFTSLFRRKTFRLFLNTRVGSDITHRQLLDDYDAVLYAVGAMNDRRLGIPGEDLPGSAAATQFVGWYNGHPDFADHSFDLTAKRAVIVGNGNVALDVARILTAGIDTLERTDIADYALEALRSSAIEEVVVLGRRGPVQAAFTTPEILGLAATKGVHVRIEGVDLDRVQTQNWTEHNKLQALRSLAAQAPQPGDRTVTLRFFAAPEEIMGAAAGGEQRVAALRVRITEPADDGVAVRATEETDDIECGLILRSVGYRGTPVADVPFDDARGVIPNIAGRVIYPADAAVAAEPVYVTGWIKRGPSGVIGTNRQCAKETVDSLLADLRDGTFDAQPDRDGDVAALLPHALDATAWRALDRHEKAEGRPLGRPRLKTTSIARMVEVARAGA